MIPDHYQFEAFFNPEPGRGEIAVLFCGKGRPAEGHKIGPAVHDYFLMHTVTAGNGTFEIRGKRYICGAGDTFVIFPGELFSYEAAASDPWHYEWVAFQGHLSEPLLAQLGVTPEQPVVRSDDARKQLALHRRLRKSLAQSEGPPLADLEAAGVLRLLLLELGLANRDRLPHKQKFATAAERQVDQAIRWLSLQFAQPISIDALAKSIGYHRTHLTKLFKEHVGLSPMQYLMQIRLERAKALLQSHWTVEQVASSVGFADSLYFSKQFRKRYGVSPTEYRQRAKSFG